MKISFVEVSGFRGFRQKVRFEFPAGFAVITGANGSGKSSVLDAVDFALTGSINKYLVKGAKGGGLDKHTWWVGEGAPEEQYVAVGFSERGGDPLLVKRSRLRGLEAGADRVAAWLCQEPLPAENWQAALMRTTLIRDEVIASLSLDLSEQQRFAAVRDAIGGLAGPNHATRTGSILKTAHAAKEAQERRVEKARIELGQALNAVTESRSAFAEQSDLVEAEHIIRSTTPGLDLQAKGNIELLRKRVAEEKRALTHIGDLLLQAELLRSKVSYHSSPEREEEVANAEASLAAALTTKEVAERALGEAQRLQASAMEADAVTSRMMALLEIGETVGLQEGHCPLCDAVRSSPEFAAAIARSREALAERTSLPADAARQLEVAKSEMAKAEEASTAAQQRVLELKEQRSSDQRELERVLSQLSVAGVPRSELDAQQEILRRREELNRLEYALIVLETSSAHDRVTALEARVEHLRERLESEEARLVAAERAFTAAGQIANAAKAVSNQVLAEHFDTVMPLLKELYARLRPHADWREIEIDVGGHVRASLNFVVGGSFNPQFLFSSGQRRAAGLAFLLAIHLSRPWCRLRSLLLDDPVQHIDDYRALNLVEVLAAIRQSGRQVVVAVEDSALADLLSRRLRSSTEESGRRFEMATDVDGSATVIREQEILPMPTAILESVERAS